MVTIAMVKDPLNNTFLWRFLGLVNCTMNVSYEISNFIQNPIEQIPFLHSSNDSSTEQVRVKFFPTLTFLGLSIALYPHLMLRELTKGITGRRTKNTITFILHVFLSLGICLHE
jgi:hypothetical protein